ncbi:fibronectin type III domain-containing protein 7-like [Ranitomeya variabilis]|uniref:fibronectin type III domain-containing protein 7-like n=1 Tax=Ranitomeya variabilis TaxID=490064 RepID=UPI0040565A52
MLLETFAWCFWVLGLSFDFRLYLRPWDANTFINLQRNDPWVSAPCAPQNVTVIRYCQINTVSLYWNPVINAIRYTANALAQDGSKEECVNRDNYCFFMNLLCGTEYELSVFAFNGKVNGSKSQGIKVRTAPCDPQNVVAIAQCSDNTVEVSWRPSLGADFYTASALGSSDISYNCSSVNTSCQIKGLQCGESLSVTVIAYDEDCESMSSAPEAVVTVPCAPENISALTDCQTQSTLVQWEYSDGAIRYIAYAKASDGSEYSCESFDQSCNLSALACSQTYTVYVIADNFQCMSPYRPTVEVKAVPCIPEIVSTELICYENTILVTWTEDTGNLTFTATAWGDSEHHNCTTLENQCEISNISCGQPFSVSVDANNGQCVSSSNRSAPLLSAFQRDHSLRSQLGTSGRDVTSPVQLSQLHSRLMEILEDGHKRICMSSCDQ